jgi:hypothetical protein
MFIFAMNDAECSHEVETFSQVGELKNLSGCRRANSITVASDKHLEFIRKLNKQEHMLCRSRDNFPFDTAR